MEFAARLCRRPIAHDPDAGAEAAAAFADLGADMAALIGATAGCSPYLAGLLQTEGAWLREALAAPPEGVVAGVLAPLPAIDLPDLGPALRRAKRRVALYAALADLGGVWPLQTVTGALTALADAACDSALRALVADEIRRGRIPGATPEDAATAAGMVIIAMGKMGAGELNYSSDIDLVCLFDDSRFAPGDIAEARAAFVKVTRRLVALASDITAEGYVFRIDLRLRPDAAVTPVCLPISAAETYYESMGRTWERAAYIKARPCAGDIAAGARFLRTLGPFVWRRHLDFAAIQDAHDMRLRIRDHKGLAGPLQVAGHNVKLGRGGIREIEFFTQTRQLIAGGRDPALRSPRTLEALGALADRGWIPAAVAEELGAHYRAHRDLEHRLQMVQDAQTQTMPTAPEAIARIARFCGEGDTDAFGRALIARCERVHALTEVFFAPTTAAPLPDLSPRMAEIVEGWRAYPALRSARAVEIFKRVRPGLLSRLMAAANPDEALIAFDGFLAGLPAGVQLFSLFEANPQLVDLIVDIAATAPALARYLSRNSAVLDAVIGGSFFAPWPGMAGLREDLAQRLAAVADYERALDAARVWAKEWHFRVGVHHLRGIVDAAEAAVHYADLAEATVGAIWPRVVADFAARHGPPPGAGAAVLGMGSLGAGRLNAGSDLDLIVIYDAEGAEASEGRRPLPVRSYYARLTQALVTALAAPMPAGRLYEVDMRLRPSGRQGPVATSLAAFRSYQETEAWTWEHLALTRARPIAGAPEVCAAVEAFRRALIAGRALADPAPILRDVAEMRARLAAARPGSAWDFKAGRGRLMDIDLIAETAALRAGSPARRPEQQIRAGVKAGVLSAAAGEAIGAALRLLWPLHASARLLGEGAADPATLGAGARAFVLREGGAADVADLEARVSELCDGAGAAIDQILGGQHADRSG